MITLRRSKDRGYFDHGWLKTFHTFSFGEYMDPKHHNFHDLRVINEDWVKAGMGFGTHPHRDMEIITYVLEGELAHEDSMGNKSVIRPGEVQRMTAGTGVQHSEFNNLKTENTHLLQIWILPDEKNLEPGYEQKNFPDSEKKNKLRLVASPDGRDGSVTIHQDVNIYSAILEEGKSLTLQTLPGRAAWLQVARGNVQLNGQLLSEGDGISAEEEYSLTLVGKGSNGSEILFFDLQ